MKVFGLLFLLLFAYFVQAQIKPADGLWHTTDDPDIGSGLVMTTQNGIMLISLFTYDENGENIWYVGSGQVDDGVLEANLFQTQGGQNLLTPQPQSATILEETVLLRIEFLWANQAQFQINGSDPKTIKPLHFGHDISYGFPDLSGQWAVANLASNQSYVLDLSLDLGISVPIAPYRDVSFVSSHPGVSGEIINCIVIFGEEAYQECKIGDFVIVGADIGNDRMVFENPQTQDQIVAVRINQAPNILPNDGHWRTVDDPDVGSGVVMRTQGQYTVVLVYSYDEQGMPEWKISSGQFDENGLFSAELLKPFGGSSMQSPEPFIAQLETQSQTIEIQLDGLELASLSIDGSEPKRIQNVNFGVEVFSTEQFMLNDTAFNYPDQEGSWLMLSDDLQESRVVNLSYYDPNWFQSPPNPSYYGARSYHLSIHEADFMIDFNCRKITRFQTYNDQWYELPEIPFCTGWYFNRPISKLTLGYFEDIGYKKFRIYTLDWDEENSHEDINRNSSYYDFYRLN